MELYRNGLKLTATIGLDESRGSVNVPVRLLHNEKDKYLNYTEQIHIRYLLYNQVKEEILPKNDTGFYIPGKPLSHDGPIELAVHLINGDIELVTNELSFIVNNAPNGTTQVDPSEFTWQQLVDQYVNAKLDTFADKADMNKFKDDVNANLSNQDKKITDLQNTTKVSLDSQNTKIDNFKSEVNTSLSNQNTSINQTTSAQNSKITTLESRMDTFTSLSEGSTTGDAELKDIRVGANGITYNNAGDAVRGQYSQLKEDLGNLEDSFIINLADKSKFTDGYCSNSGNIVSPSGNYFFTDKISVKGGETIHFNGTKIRFLTAYKNGVVSETDGLGVSESKEYVVPENVTEIVITSTPEWLENTRNLMVNRGNKLYDYIPYGDRSLKADKLEIVKKVLKNSNSAFTENLANGVNLECETNNIVKNKNLLLYAEFSTFDSIVVGHGFLSYDGSALLIDNTNVQIVKYMPSGEVIETVAHNLNISDFINVSISVNSQRQANVLITTKTGGFILNDIPWDGCSGEPFVRPRNCNLTNCKLTFACTDYSRQIWAFGDSYMTTTAPTRYPYYLYNLGIDNYLLDAFAGRTSIQALESLKNALKYGTPKYLLWFLGMNDPDTDTTSNADWYIVYNEIVDICKAKGITPIFARIPCTPTNNNWYKNRVIENSGYRFVNFAKAVGANDIGSSWNSGLLSGDNLHPTEMGAKVLANQLLIDFNEIIN